MVLRHATLSEMWQPLYLVEGDESIGLSFFTVRRGRSTLVGHNGNQAGFVAFLYLNPATGAGIVAAFNTDNDLPHGDQPLAFGPLREYAIAQWN